MTLTPMPYLTIQEFDSDGVPLAGAKMFFYVPGTTTKQDTFSDAAGAVPNTNPVVLDAAGRATVFFSLSAYDIVLAPSTDTDPPTSPIWTRSGVLPIPPTNADLDISGIAGEALAINDSVVLSDGTVGTAGRWYKSDADAAATSTTAKAAGFAPAAIASGSTGTIRLQGRITGLTSLTAGDLMYASATAGAITSTPPALALVVGVADSTTSLITQPSADLNARMITAEADIVALEAVTVPATELVPGIVSISAQSFAGVKSFGSPPLFAPGSTALGVNDATLSGGFYKNATSVDSDTGSVINMTGDITVGANTLTVAGKTLRLTAFLHTAANANNKQLDVFYGGTSYFSSGVFTGAGARLNIKIVTDIVYISASVQQIVTVMVHGGVPASGQTFVQNNLAGNKDNTASQVLKIQAATATANADIVFDCAYGEIVG